MATRNSTELFALIFAVFTGIAVSEVMHCNFLAIAVS